MLLKPSMSLKTYKDGNKQNPTIIFLHGFPLDHRMWKSQIEFLKDKYYCISYDILQKLEKSKNPEPIPFEFLVDDFLNLLEKKKIQKPIVCGLSMGGYILLRAIEKKPDAFSKLILCNTKTEADTNEGKLKRVDGIRKINSEGLKDFIKEFTTNALCEFTCKANPEIYKSALKIAKDRTPNATKAILLAMQGRTDTTHVLKTISIPTLVIGGEYDSLTPPESMEKLANQIPNSSFVKIPDAGHFAPFENPKFTNQKILEFLEK